MADLFNGIYENMPAATYHAHPSISKSGLDLIARSPAHYRLALQREETRNMMIGSATHAAILEPERYASYYVVARDADDRRCKAWNAAAKDVPGADERLLTGPEGLRIETMANAVRSNPHFAELLNAGGRAELSVFATDPETGVQVRIRLDWLTNDLRALDLKTTQDLRNDEFLRSVWDYRYHVQEAFYRDVFKWATGEELRDWRFGAIESTVPHVCSLVSLPPDLLLAGRIAYRRDLNRYAECLAKDQWPGPQPEPFTLELTPWVINRVEDVLEEALLADGEMQ